MPSPEIHWIRSLGSRHLVEARIEQRTHDAALCRDLGIPPLRDQQLAAGARMMNELEQLFRALARSTGAAAESFRAAARTLRTRPEVSDD